MYIILINKCSQLMNQKWPQLWLAKMAQNVRIINDKLVAATAEPQVDVDVYLPAPLPDPAALPPPPPLPALLLLLLLLFRAFRKGIDAR